MAGSLIGGDPSAPSRVASFVVSGVGFLGAGVIFKEISTHGRQNEMVEEIAVRLSIEPSVTSLSWSVTPTAQK
jgi:uncharacterized membrane protein YhiD involved in acid resistance